ncbi:hypothetical protein C8R47DRAFT_978900 [Mycena vitilis]|nr:hypothetical protein C8R47DRAFT_978900 [Mycena vitilis]
MFALPPPDGVAPAEEEAGVVEDGPEPTHLLSDFFGPEATIPGFTLVPSCVIFIPFNPLTDCLPREERPVLDAAYRVVAVIGGMPDPDFMANIHDPAVEAMESARSQASISEEQQSHRRGVFTQLTAGISFGGGQVRPGAINTAVLCSLLSNDTLIRLAGFATALLAEWAPNPFSFYVEYMGRFHRHYPDLHCPFANGIFSACTFNLGPRTCALGHRDFVNFALGWCPIIAFGDFDYKKGGHLILWDCKLIIEFPPGCTILIPSATVFHSKIPIAPHEHRYSFTQYTAGGLFRWVERGFKSEEDYFASLSAEGRREEKILGRQRAAAAADMFSINCIEFPPLPRDFVSYLNVL